MADANNPSTSEILTAMQGMWGQQKDLILGVEERLEQKLSSKIESEVRPLKGELLAAKEELGDRITREIRDRPVIVHVDMGRVSELEKSFERQHQEFEALAKRVAELETRRQG
jgi:hypothetical protein